MVSEPSGLERLSEPRARRTQLQGSWCGSGSAPQIPIPIAPQINSASRWRFRPPLRLTFRLPPTRPPVEPRPNLAPCSLQGGSYGRSGPASRTLERSCPQIAIFSLRKGVFVMHRLRSKSRNLGFVAGPSGQNRQGRAAEESMLRRAVLQRSGAKSHAKSD